MAMTNITPELIDRMTTVCDKLEKRMDSMESRKDGGQGSGIQGHSKGKAPIYSNSLDKGAKERQAKEKPSFKL